MFVRVAAVAAAALTLAVLGHGAVGADDEAPVQIADGAVVQRDTRVPAAVPLRPTGDGYLVVDRTRPPVGTGRLVTYTVEVTHPLRDQAGPLSRAVSGALDNVAHGWGREARLQQIADPGAATIRILLADPAQVDGLCAQAGYATNGQYSCWNGRFAALNSRRWFSGAAGFASLPQYRTYQVNHEFGHGLGHAHEYCAGAGQLAPLMMQQSKGLLGCRPNPWPTP
ncbi:MAG: DUF3152 domain-containing protein [Candidatus Nanopelagicales bacterium]